MAMDHQNTQPAEGPGIPQFGDLVVSLGHETSLSQLPPEAQLATMRQMLETVFQRMETLQQNQAIQFAGVHDRLDSVELELPLMQEQSALRLRDLETRMSSQIEDAAKSAVEEAAAGLQEQVAGKFGSLEAQIEGQRNELDQLRESRKQVESRLSRAVLDIERLCGSLSPGQGQAPDVMYRSPAAEAPSQFKSRIAEHIRRAAVDAAPDESNPLVGDPLQKRPAPERGPVEILTDAARPAASATQAPIPSPVAPIVVHRAPPDASAPPSTDTAPKTVGVETAVPGFDDWKRQFMQEGDPLLPSLGHGVAAKTRTVVCPRCFSERTRPATRTKIDGLFRLTGFTPHRCRSCAHRFYKRVTGSDEPFEDHNGDSRTEEALETR